MSTRIILLLAASLLAPYQILLATVYPIGGVQQSPLVQGRTMHIQWDNDMEASSVDVGIWDGITARTTVVARNIPAMLGTYVWSIPEDLSTGDRYRVIVRDSDHPQRAQFSAGFLSIGRSLQQVASTVKEIDNGADVQCTPFPARDVVTVSWTNRSVARIELVDIHQRTVFTADVDQNADHTTMDVRSLASGMFFARLVHKTGAIVMTPVLIGR